MSAVAAVKYIADNVQFINDRVLDELRMAMMKASALPISMMLWTILWT